jgi:hypothetical protein
MAKKAGAWISFDKDLIQEILSETSKELPEKIQGLEQLRSFLEENDIICKYLFNKFKSALVK